MNRLRFKSIVATAAIVLLLIATGLLMMGVVDLFAYFQKASAPASPLNLIPEEAPTELAGFVSWLPDDPDTGRVMEPFTRRQIENAFLYAWLQLDLSYERGEPFGLKTYFVGPGLAAATQVVEQVAADGWRIRQRSRGHELQLHFYSADGSIVAFTDHDAIREITVLTADGEQIFAGELSSTYEVVMFLEDGNWRVRHWVQQ